jgi:hypothetical protein
MKRVKDSIYNVKQQTKHVPKYRKFRNHKKKQFQFLQVHTQDVEFGGFVSDSLSIEEQWEQTKKGQDNFG